MEVRGQKSNCSTLVIHGSGGEKKERSQRKVLLRRLRRWAEMNKEHGHRCSDKLFTPFFSAVLPAAFSSACH